MYAALKITLIHLFEAFCTLIAQLQDQPGVLVRMCLIEKSSCKFCEQTPKPFMRTITLYRIQRCHQRAGQGTQAPIFPAIKHIRAINKRHHLGYFSPLLLVL